MENNSFGQAQEANKKNLSAAKNIPIVHKKELNELNEIKSRFIGMASHEYPYSSLKKKPGPVQIFLNIPYPKTIKRSFLSPIKSLLHNLKKGIAEIWGSGR